MQRRPRLDKTLADYVAIAIGPVLIMFLIGSLVFFLLTVFYQGQFQGRLHFIMCCFIMATVLIGRISMEEGTDHAVMYGIPLALVTALATWRFVEVRGAMAAFSPFINMGVLALIWWSAHKLTWDCTLMDETENASGQGLLQNIGMDDTPAKADLPATSQGSSSNDVEDRMLNELAEKSWWSRLVDKRHQPHPPGLWVVYFSLAALPLFGIGQWFLPAQPASVRVYAFFLLACYVGSALALLLSTSFLGLRRYLRQRHIEMPGNMAFGWIGTGGLMIVVLLLVCSVLPRPGSFGSDKPPIQFGSPEDVRPNSWSLGDEGVEEEGGDPYEPEEGAEDDPSDTGPGAKSRNDDPAGNTIDKNADKTKTGKSGEPGSKGQQAKAGKSSPQGRDSSPAKGREAGGKSKSGKSKNDKGKSGKRQSGKGGSKSKGGESSGQKKSGNAKSQDKNDKSGNNDHAKSNSGGAKKSDQGKNKGEGKSGGDNEKSNGAEAKGDGKTDGKGKNQSKDDKSTSQGGKSQGGLSFNEKSSSPDPNTPPDRLDSRDNKSSSAKSTGKKRNKKTTKRRKRRPGKSKQKKSRRTPMRMSSNWLQSMGSLLRWLMTAAVIAVVAYLAWKNWAAIVAAWKKLLEDIRNWFAGKRADQPVSTELAAEKATPERPFSTYRNPFDSGMAEERPPADVIRYTFEAVEAWARERGLPRKDEQTVYEFAHQIGAVHDDVAVGAKTLAQLYSQAAYAQESLPKSAARHLKQLWRDLNQS